MINRTIRCAVAPMVDVTDQHYRILARILSTQVDLYTEMMVARQIVKQPDVFKRIRYVPNTTIQIAGDDAETMKQAIGIAHSTGLFESFNINAGCPASSARSGSHGAVLLKDRPKLIRLLAPISEYCNSQSIDLSVKLRIGVDEHTSYDWFISLIRDIYQQTGITRYIVHARPALLNLNTQQNRTIPALNYNFVAKAVNDLNAEFGKSVLNIELNGGITSTDQLFELQQQIPDLAGFMIGRWFEKRVMDLQVIDDAINRLNDQPMSNSRGRISPDELIDRYLPHLATQPYGFAAVRPLFSIFSGRIGRVWRAELSRGRQQGMSLVSVVQNALHVKNQHIRDVQLASEMSAPITQASQQAG